MNIGIVGMGVVGKALHEYYKGQHAIWTYDKAKDDAAALDALNANAEVVFICVGTPYAGPGKGLDCSQVHAAVDALTGSKTVVIKSTVMPGTTDAIQSKHPEHKMLFVPEFLNEDTAAEDYAKPRRSHVVGCTYRSWHTMPFVATDLLPRYAQPDSDGSTKRVVYLPATQAELLKLATNSFYALKVAFANQMYDIGMTQESLDALGEDNWIYPYHLQVEHKGFRGFGGTCLPKDTAALYDYALMSTNTLPKLLCSATAYNNILCAEQGINVDKWLYKQNSKEATSG